MLALVLFKKTRYKILLLNMLMASAVVIVAFVVIFATTYSRVQSENSMKLSFDSPIQLQRAVTVEPSLIGGMIQLDSESLGYMGVTPFSRLISPRAGVSFSVIVDSDTNILEIDSIVDLPLESYTRGAIFAMEDMGGHEIVTIEGRMWQFAVSPFTSVYGGVETAPYAEHLYGNYSHIRFVDVTDSHQMLRSLAFTLSGSGLAVLAIFFFISRYFAAQAVKPMEEAWEKQRRFIADASHELKTPLSVINANCGVLYANKEETLEGQIKWVDSISRASDRMTGLVGSLLSLASLEDSKLELNNSPFDLSGEVEAAIGEMEAVAIEKGIRINKMIEPGIVVESDREQIRKILSILLDNAAKYTDSGGEVAVSLRKEKRNIVCLVRNSGAGIPEEDLPQVFDRFYRGDPARSSENNGYGLGLAIAKAIAAELGAELSAASAHGEYTEFSLTFGSH